MLNRKDNAISSVVRGEGHVIRLSRLSGRVGCRKCGIRHVRNQTSGISNCRPM